MIVGDILKRKRNSKIKILIFIIIIIAIMLALSSHIISDKKKLNFFEKAIKDSGSFIEKIAYIPVDFVKNKINFLIEKDKIYNKYIKLKKKVEKTDIYYDQIKELQKENAELKSELELNSTLSEYTFVNSTVVSRDIGYWYNTLTIDKGKKNKVKLGDAVITNEGLIGKISSVSNFSSTVKLLNNDEILNKISIKIEHDNEYYYGLLIGYDINLNVYKIEGNVELNKIKEGDIVTTTGLTDYFPSGILIGKVKRVVMDEYDLNSIVQVTPSVNFNNISIVSVLNR